VRYLKGWVDQLRWQRLPAFEKLANMLAAHLDGILNYCRTKYDLVSWKASTPISAC